MRSKRWVVLVTRSRPTILKIGSGINSIQYVFITHQHAFFSILGSSFSNINRWLFTWTSFAIGCFTSKTQWRLMFRHTSTNTCLSASWRLLLLTRILILGVLLLLLLHHSSIETWGVFACSRTCSWGICGNVLATGRSLGRRRNFGKQRRRLVLWTFG